MRSPLIPLSCITSPSFTKFSWPNLKRYLSPWSNFTTHCCNGSLSIFYSQCMRQVMLLSSTLQTFHGFLSLLKNLWQSTQSGCPSSSDLTSLYSLLWSQYLSWNGFSPIFWTHHPTSELLWLESSSPATHIVYSLTFFKTPHQWGICWVPYLKQWYYP